MKRISIHFLLMALVATLASACSFAFSNKVNGSGHVTRIGYRVESFNKIDISTVLDVVVIPGKEEKVIVETDDNLQQYVIVESGANALNLKMKEHVNIGKRTAGKIYIYTKGVEVINNSSVGRLTSQDTLKANTFRLDNSSVGTTDLKIKAQTITVKNSAVGSTSLYLQSEKLDLDNSAVGKTELTGNCPQATIKNSSVGAFMAGNFITQVLHINNSAVGKTEIYAEKEFYIDNNAVGKLEIFGNGVIKQLNDNGIEKVKKH
ncbi:GIN domain-containing protein [Parabacteroides sp. FAFU027]|uniref:GIN domain-containing protein n=1 Tax=Parabacteroides sp. FAFU027 TaxID=2922715 RepID=UPI001FAF97CA|nr:DUF2807 domain-containing protein [Parabacteroides sp. FAFU027]